MFPELLENGNFLFQEVLETSVKWGTAENMMYVVGATKAKDLKEIRKIIPKHFLLIPGIGAQGGDLDDVIKNGINNDIGVLINSSRGIIYAGNDKDFDSKSRDEAMKIKNSMSKYL